MFSYVFWVQVIPRFSLLGFPTRCSSPRLATPSGGGSWARAAAWEGTPPPGTAPGDFEAPVKNGAFFWALQPVKKTRNSKKIGSWSNWWAMIFGQERIECWKNWERLVSNNWGIWGSKMCTIYPSNVQTCANSGRFNLRKYGNWSKKSNGFSSLSTRFYTRWNCGFV